MERNRSDEKPKRKAHGAALPRADVTRALRRAFLREWASRGYAGLSLEAVAARAGVGKAALYRRWSSKAAMAAEIIGDLAHSVAPPPDTGSLAGDVRAFQRSLARLVRHPLVRHILPDLHAERTRSPELAALLDAITTSRRARGEVLLRRAVERGELPVDLDHTLALDLIAAPIYWRMVIIGSSMDEDDLAANAAAFLAAIGAKEGKRKGAILEGDSP